MFLKGEMIIANSKEELDTHKTYINNKLSRWDMLTCNSKYFKTGHLHQRRSVLFK